MKFITKLLIVFNFLLCLVSPCVLAEDLPAKYDLRDVNGVNYVTPVKNQSRFGTCWAHASVSVAETSSILKGGSPNVNLSEKALSWYEFQLQGSKDMLPEDYEGLNIFRFDITWEYDPSSRIYSSGGGPFTPLSQMSTWLGCSTEEQVPYLNTEGTYLQLINGAMADPNGDWTLPYSDIYDNAYHLQDDEILYSFNVDDSLTPETFTTKAKELMLKYVAGPTYNDQTFSQYCPQYVPANHAVCIVGWDDDYPASNFNTTPPGNGAWIFKNSWGPNDGDNGYFYLSYYDHSINSVSGFNVETEENGYSYDKNYEYDFHNVKGDYSQDCFEKLNNEYDLASIDPENIKTANIFTATSDQTLRAVSCTPNLHGTSQVTAQVYLLNNGYTSPEDGTLVATVTESYENPGFYTMELPQPIPITQGTKFAVVQQMSFSNTQFENKESQLEGPVIESLPIPSIEFGLVDTVLQDNIDSSGQNIGFSDQENIVKVEPGQSYVYGLNGTVGTTAPAWMDITSEEITQKLSLPITIDNPDGTSQENTLTPGNAMIKAYTTFGIGDDVINPTNISLTKSKVYLSTLPDGNGINKNYVSALLEPANSTTNVSWSVSPAGIVSLDESSGTTISYTALNEGTATITATTGNELVATFEVIVTNEPILCDGIDIISYSPDSFSVVARNVVPNHVIRNSETPTRVSLFAWSDENQKDLNTKLMYQIPGTNDWICEGIPVNNTHSYFNNAMDIQISVYASSTPNSTGHMIGTATTDWIFPGDDTTPNVYYIAYNQNTGFVRPTVNDGATSGNIGDPYSVHMEGLRISSGLEGLEINTTVHAVGTGWLPQVGDGVYAGTMEENRALDSIVLTLSSDIEDLDKLTEFQYRVYLKDVGWTDWVSGGQQAGTPDSGNPIQAIQVNLKPIEISTGQ